MEGINARKMETRSREILQDWTLSIREKTLGIYTIPNMN